MVLKHKFGAPWRPVEQAGVERIHQEAQTILGIMTQDFLKTFPDEWTEMLPAVEFTTYNTPGPHGFSPRDLDRRWSLGTRLERDLQPFQVMDFEPISEWATQLFTQYKQVRELVIRHMASSSYDRAQLANRFHKAKEFRKGDRVAFRDPRARAFGGRTPWKKPLTDPCVVTKIKGNKLTLRKINGTEVEGHLEDCVLLPNDARQLECRDPVEFEDEADPSREPMVRSPGQMMEDARTEKEPDIGPVPLHKTTV